MRSEFNMSDNEDLLADDLGDQSLADYNLGNEEEEQLLADDYESGASQNVPTSMGPSYGSGVEMVPNDFSGHGIDYGAQLPYQAMPEPECVVPNITVEVPNAPLPEHNVFPYEQPPVYGPEHAVVPPPIPAAVPMESSQIVPSEMPPPPMNVGARRGAGPRLPIVRDLPDSLDAVIVRGQRGRGWRPQRFSHPYHRNNMHRNNFQHHNQRASFPPPQIRPNPPPGPGPRPEIRPDRPEIQPDPVPIAPPMPIRPELSPERPMLQEVPFRPEFGPNFQPRFQFRPEERNFRPNFSPVQRFPIPRFAPRPFGPPVREIVPNNVSHMPQVTIRQPMVGREPEVRMLPLQLPPNLPPGGLAGKKVLINPHFKGNFQPVDGVALPAYIPTRIHKSPPLSPTLENKFGPIKDIDDAAERFIAEQRNALARAAGRKFRRSPQRYIENTTIEIENELAAAPVPARRSSDDELLRRQEEFINANRAGLRRRMRTPSPVDPPRETRSPARDSRSPPSSARSARPARRSASPRRSPERRRPDPPRDEESEYRRRMREQESLRERVLRAKELRRRKNAVAATHTSQNNRNNDNRNNDTRNNDARNNDRERDRERQDKERDSKEPPRDARPEDRPAQDKPDSTDRDKMRERSPVRSAEVNSTSETLTPPRDALPRVSATPEPALTPPLPDTPRHSVDKPADKPTDKPADKPADKSTDRSLVMDSDDELDLILGDIDGILSDDDDSGRFKEKAKKPEPEPAPPAKPAKPANLAKPARQADLRSKLPPRADKLPKQRIVFSDDNNKESSPPRRAAASSSTVHEDADNVSKASKAKQKAEANTNKSRQRIIFDRKEPQQPEKKEKEEERKPQPFPNRRVILQTKFTQAKEKSVFARIEAKADPVKPNPGSIFSRAVRTAIGSEKTRIVVKKDEPTVEYGTDSDDEGTALVSNLPAGITDTRLKTLAGGDVQTLVLDKEACSARITFRSPAAAELFKRKFDNKMVSKSRLSVKLT